jgi:hypothetical protein
VVTIDGVEVDGSALAGLQLASGGTANGRDLLLRRNPVGANLQELPDGYVLADSVEGLVLEANGTDLDETELSIAEVLPAGP